MIPGSANPLLLASAAQAGGYAIDRSLRFNSADSAYLSRTPASAGNRKTWTWAGWVKRSQVGTQEGIFSAGTSLTDDASFGFGGGIIEVFNRSASAINARLQTTAVFRDLSAWYHIVFVWNTTSSTASDRVQIWVNGSRVTTFNLAAYPAQNTDSIVNNIVAHYIGSQTLNNYNNTYLADIHFIDGQALDPTSFGEFDTNGIWQPKAYTGTYGTNGFHLTFSDNSTAGSLGDDTSGNSNDWTVNNISVAAGAGNDSLVDVPTNGSETDTGLGGEVRGNYATWNSVDSTSQLTPFNGSLELIGTGGGSTYGNSRASFSLNSGKFYWETLVSAATIYQYWGIAPSDTPLQSGGAEAIGLSGIPNSVGLYCGNGNIAINNSVISSGSGALTAGDVVGHAFDGGTGAYWISINGVWRTGDPALGTSPVTTVSLTPKWFPAASEASNQTLTANFGQRSWAYQAPAGFKALCTANLPAPVVTKPSDYMDVKLYTGNGSTQTISGLEFSPDLVWIKTRSGAQSHRLYDAIRGAAKELYSDLTNAESIAANALTAFNADGFTLGSDSATNGITATFAAWCWDAGSSTVTNTQGSITSQVRANPSAGFSVVTYTGTGSNATVGHGLNVAPSLIIVKCRSAANDWAVYHAANTADPKTDYLLLNSTAATADDNTYWNDTAPASTVFSIGANADVNTSTATYVAYCWTGLDGYTSMSSYTGNGSADGPFVFTNMRPRWILIKRTDTTSNWTIIDTAREGYNVDNDPLFPNLSNAEGTTDLADILSNGFKLRSTDASVNASAGTYIYFAVGEAAFSVARAR